MLTETVLTYSTYQLIIRTSIYILEGYKYHMLVHNSVGRDMHYYMQGSGFERLTPTYSPWKRWILACYL